MEERKIKLATLALLTPIKEVLNDVVMPASLSDVAEAFLTFDAFEELRIKELYDRRYGYGHCM